MQQLTAAPSSESFPIVLTVETRSGEVQLWSAVLNRYLLDASAGDRHTKERDYYQRHAREHIQFCGCWRVLASHAGINADVIADWLRRQDWYSDRTRESE